MNTSGCQQVPPTLVVLASDQRRGAELEGSQLAAQLRSDGHPVDVIALRGSSANASRVEVDALGTDPLALSTLRRLRRRSRNYEIVVGYGSSTLPACAIGLTGSNVRFIYRSIGDPSVWVRSPWHRRRTSLLFRRTDDVVALWSGAADSITRLYGVPRTRITVIPNARSSTDFTPPSERQKDTARRRLQLPADVSVLSCVGALVPEKRIDLAIRSIIGLDVHLAIAGDGELRANLESLARNVAPGRVHFVGRLVDVEQLLHATDVLLLTSKTEGMPGAIIEAGMCAVPTVATRVGAVEELIVDGVTGHITDDDEAHVRLAIRLTLDAAPTLGPAARQDMLMRFAWSAVRPKWVQTLTGCRLP
jgi:glycosyltransferase involved in cell wall biosynthesis